jgi:predicted branched-subunit amino acid permease
MIQRERRIHCGVDVAESGVTMAFTALFLAVTIVMLVARRGSRSLALALFAITLLDSVATYRHHATDRLETSF